MKQQSSTISKPPTVPHPSPTNQPPQTHQDQLFNPKKTQSLTTPSSSIPTIKTLLLSSSQTPHTSPASGYAAAHVDIAQGSNMTLDLVNRDVRRFLKLINTKNVEAVLESHFVGLEEKGLVMTDEDGSRGRFNRVLVRLVKMLVGIVKDVLEEFGRVYDELSGVTHGLLVGM